jgi:2-oxoglutarate dehydrogenase E1 component
MSPAEGDDRRGNTAVPVDTLRRVGAALTTVPATFNSHKTVQRLLQQKAQMLETGEGIDWATAEALAFGTLLDEGYHVRLEGQDAGRGTFSQRHAALVDQSTEERYYPLLNVREGQGDFEVIDSLLSEEAALGFEYGYALAEPRALVVWEAQFGDFANGAQAVIDQFITSGERKWLRMNCLVMLLPHGYEGQGPEHSSARLERFLQLCAEDNVQVGNVSTPANYFHVLRRQIHRNFRKPLILMTPKSLLRHKRCVSTLEELGPTSHLLVSVPCPPSPCRFLGIQASLVVDDVCHGGDNFLCHHGQTALVLLPASPIHVLPGSSSQPPNVVSHMLGPRIIVQLSGSVQQQILKDLVDKGPCLLCLLASCSIEA